MAQLRCVPTQPRSRLFLIGESLPNHLIEIFCHYVNKNRVMLSRPLYICSQCTCVQGTVVEFLTKGHVGYFIEVRMVS